jgi:long-chain acyl-CoA synthetase
VLYQHADIREVAVYGLPDPVKGEKVAIAAVLREGAELTAEGLIQYCRDRLAVYKAPEFVQFVRELPKSATGKILKRVLRDQGGAR